MILLIFYNYTFCLGMNKRTGTLKDGENLQNIFSRLGFIVHMLYDANIFLIEQKLQELSSTNHSLCNCFAIAILSHGDEEYIYATDYKVQIKSIVDMFHPKHCPSLLGKPKIFLFQACRGNEHEVGLDVANEVTDGAIREEVYGDRVVYVDCGVNTTVPAGADFIMCYSVAEGFYSHRDTRDGSWYIQDFKKAFDSMLFDKQEGSIRVDFIDILTRVNRTVSKRSVERSYNIDSIGKKQMPCFSSLLTKKLVFTSKQLRKKSP